MPDLGKSQLLRRLYERSPRLRYVMREVNGLLTKRALPTFDGWLMTTYHQVPWVDDPDFLETADAINRFERSEAPSSPAETAALMWRHWHVSYSVRHAIAHTRATSISGVECGVGDGYTAHFALSEMQTKAEEYELHLYDAWELGALEGAYSGLSRERTARNLGAHNDRLRWHPGFVPATLDGSGPETLHWMHVDLNSAEATVAVLEFFWPRLADGGVVLFDDYGWLSEEPTRIAVSSFLDGRPGTLLPLPTGQAIYFR